MEQETREVSTIAETKSTNEYQTPNIILIPLKLMTTYYGPRENKAAAYQELSEIRMKMKILTKLSTKSLKYGVRGNY